MVISKVVEYLWNCNLACYDKDLLGSTLARCIFASPATQIKMVAGSYHGMTEGH